MSVPTWLKDAVFYQIFPDRFHKIGLPLGVQGYEPWGAPPTIHGFQGGDLPGITAKLDYLSELGVNAIYLNPIFQSPSNHRYNTTDYFRIDPKLGTLKDFREFLAAAHRFGMKVVLDGVFNHCGRGFFAFNDILENQQRSVYRDWFHVNHYPLDAYSGGDAKTYQAWWGFKSLPKFNTDNPGVRAHIFEVVEFWTRMGIDGWRLDVPNEINDDGFWKQFRDLVKGINSEAYLIGEIWDINPRWVGENHFDGLMNYPLRSAVLEFANSRLTPGQFAEKVRELERAYPLENLYSHLNLVGSHDTERVLQQCGGDRERLALVFGLLFTMPGVPCVYYGDEIGMDGGKDPDCRRAFPWEQEKWDVDLRDKVKALIQARRKLPALQSGTIEFLDAGQDGLLAYRRSSDQGSVLVMINPGSALQRMNSSRLGIDRSFRDVLGGGSYKAGVEVEISPKRVLILE